MTDKIYNIEDIQTLADWSEIDKSIAQQFINTMRENERLKEAISIADTRLRKILKENTLANALETIAKSTNDPFAMQAAWNALNQPNKHSNALLDRISQHTDKQLDKLRDILDYKPIPTKTSEPNQTEAFKRDKWYLDI